MATRYLERNFFDAQGYSGAVYYYRIVRRRDGKIWDYVNAEFKAASATTWLNTAHIMPAVGTTGQYSVYVEANLPRGDTYDFAVYKQAGSYPQNTDDVQTSYQKHIGGDFGF